MDTIKNKLTLVYQFHVNLLFACSMLYVAQLSKLNGTLYDSHLVLLIKALSRQCPTHTHIIFAHECIQSNDRNTKSMKLVFCDTRIRSRRKPLQYNLHFGFMLLCYKRYSDSFMRAQMHLDACTSDIRDMLSNHALCLLVR